MPKINFLCKCGCRDIEAVDLHATTFEKVIGVTAAGYLDYVLLDSDPSSECTYRCYGCKEEILVGGDDDLIEFLKEYGMLEDD